VKVESCLDREWNKEGLPCFGNDTVLMENGC